MFDLDAGVHLDEEPIVLVHVVEELDGAGVVVADALGKFYCGIAEFLADLRIEVHCGCDLHDFLVAALDRAIALVEVDDISVLVAEDLYLDVFRALDIALEENGGVAEGVLGFRACLGEKAGELGGFLHDAHAAATTTERGLDDEWKTDFVGDGKRLVGIGDRFLRAGEGGDVELVGEGAGGGLVAHVIEQIRRGSDESDALSGAGTCEVRVFREEAVARVDHGHTLGFGEFHDAFVIKICTYGAFRGVELVGFVGLEAVD